MRSQNKSQQSLFADLLSLEKGQAESEALFLSIGEGAFVTDSRSYVARVNKPALDILGYNKKDLIGKWYPGRVVAEDESGHVISPLERPITRAFLSGKPIAERIYYRKKDGSRVAVSLNVSPILLGGIPIGAIEIFRDISQEIKLEKAKDEFISLASHQLRTPATGVKQYLGIVLQGFAGDITDQQRSMLERAYESNERQLRIISDLLKVAQVDAGKITLRRTKFDLNTLIEDIIKEQQSMFASRHQQVVFERSHPELLAYIDHGIIRMMFENIIDNASKYSPEHTQITIKTDSSADEAYVTIADQGVGIRREDKKKLFEKFSRFDNTLSVKVGGTGIGLYWAKKIIDLHRGSITLTSKINKGTCFTIQLPKELDINDFRE